MTVVEARRYQNEGHFAPGGMKPKIEACIRFLEQHSRADARCIITNRKTWNMPSTATRGRTSSA